MAWDEQAFQRRVDAVWGNIAADDLNVPRAWVEASLRAYHQGEQQIAYAWLLAPPATDEGGDDGDE